jgi:hypothetical protein
MRRVVSQSFHDPKFGKQYTAATGTGVALRHRNCAQPCQLPLGGLPLAECVLSTARVAGLKSHVGKLHEDRD